MEISDTFIKGTKVSLTNPELVLRKILEYDYSATNYISLFGVYPLVKSFENDKLQSVLNDSYLNPLHGKYIEYYLRFKGNECIKTVDGVFLLDRLLNEPLSHYFYGASWETLNKIRENIELNYPNAVVKGYQEPPMVTLDELENNEELIEHFIEINNCQPSIVWIGLGGIKQDLVMNYYSKYLNNSLLIGVGAVFDYFAGNLKLSSDLVKHSGFRWLHRLLRQPELISKKIEILKIMLSLPFRKGR